MMGILTGFALGVVVLTWELWWPDVGQIWGWIVLTLFISSPWVASVLWGWEFGLICIAALSVLFYSAYYTENRKAKRSGNLNRQIEETEYSKLIRYWIGCLVIFPALFVSYKIVIEQQSVFDATEEFFILAIPYSVLFAFLFRSLKHRPQNPIPSVPDSKSKNTNLS